MNEKTAVQVLTVTVGSVRHLSGRYCLLGLPVPPKFSEPAPGQFVMVRTPERYPILPRPISVHDWIRRGRGGVLEILFQETGEGTARLAALEAGKEAVLWGPIGRGFEIDLSGGQVLVAGGRGMAPLWFLAKRIRAAAPKIPITLYYGARSSAELHYIDEFRSLDVKVHIATDDGSKGYRGVITDLLAEKAGAAAASHQISIFEDPSTKAGEEGKKTVFYACGPDAMMERVHEIASWMGARCQVSLEAHMACGMGVCLGCACEARGGELLHVCKDGPVMESARAYGGPNEKHRD